MTAFGLFCLSRLTAIDPEPVESLAHQAGKPALLVEFLQYQNEFELMINKISQQGACVAPRGWESRGRLVCVL